MPTDEALELLRGLAADPPPPGPMGTPDEIAASLSRVADLREAADAAVAALREQEERAIYAARGLLRDYGGATAVGRAVRRPRQHVNTVVNARRAADAARGSDRVAG